MDKSPDAFRTISEVAEHLETPAHVLRFWESRFPQIRPVKRAGGRRYYRPSDVSLLMGIKRLLHDEGMTIRGVQKILREQGVRHVAGLSGDAVDDDAGFFDLVADAGFKDRADVTDRFGDDVGQGTVYGADDGPQDAPFDAVDDGVDDAPFDAVDDPPRVAPDVLHLKPKPVMLTPAPGLTEAMAKVVDQRYRADLAKKALNASLPMQNPAQGALMLTPVAVVPAPAAGRDGEGVTPDPQTSAPANAAKRDLPEPVLQEGDLDADFAATDFTNPDFVDPDSTDLDPDSTDLDAAAPYPAAPDFTDADFGDDDFDAGPAITLASRIRALPSEASARAVGAELRAAVARLQALRDRMADGAQSRQS